jgi:hypothetical protein
MREYVGLVSETRRLEANYNLGFAISSFHSFDRIVASLNFFSLSESQT